MRSAAILRLPGALVAPVGLVLISLALGAGVVHNPQLIRLTVAAIVLVAVLAMLTVRASTAVLVLMTLLPFLALGRRMLLDFQSWQTTDPLLLVAPTVAAVLLFKLYVLEGRPLAPDRLSRFVLALLAITLLQSVNPDGGSIVAGVSGLLFAAAPLLWFFIGRDLLDNRSVQQLLALTLPVGATVALYGLYQSQHGLPSWDAKWLPDALAYNALIVGDRIRSFGTFSSAAEYSVYLAVALAVAAACVIRGRVLALAVVPLLAWALFLGSSRTIVVLAFAAAVVIVGASTGNGRIAAVVAVAALGAAFAVVHSSAGSLSSRAAASGNPLITHQVDGLTNPLDPQQSTMLLHLRSVVAGFKKGLTNPIGHGVASTTLAGGKFGGNVQNAEVDVVDAFIGLGLPGGLAFLGVLLLSLRRAALYALAKRNFVALATFGVLIVTLGQWLNGGYYAISVLVWSLLGMLARETAYVEKTDETAQLETSEAF